MIDNLPPLKDVIRQYQLSADKSLGQHFLLDMNLLHRIVREANIEPTDHVVEIGCGPGGLTRALCSVAQQVSVVEKDSRFLEAIEPLNAKVYLTDALKFNFQTLGDIKIVANLPYNISSPLLVHLLSFNNIKGMVLMFQKEVAERIVAAPNTKQYGRLSVLAQLCCHCKILFPISPQAFTPPPKVWSAVVSFSPKKYDFNIKKLEKLTAAAFGQRRKMLRSSLKNVVTSEQLLSLGIDPAARAESLSPQQFKEILTITV